MNVRMTEEQATTYHVLQARRKLARSILRTTGTIGCLAFMTYMFQFAGFGLCMSVLVYKAADEV